MLSPALINLVLMLLLAITTAAQPNHVIEVPKSAADCQGAIKLGEEIGPIRNIQGFGFFQEIENNSRQYPFLWDHERNPCWFKYHAEDDGQLEIIIKSVNPGDNYNFALYSSPGQWFCNNFPFEFIQQPARANCSSADIGIGITGISAEGTDSLAADDAGNAFCKLLNVTKGEAFFLIVDSATRPQSGYTVTVRIKPNATVNNE